MRILGLLITVLFLGASSTWGFGEAGDLQGGHRSEMCPYFVSNLNLTDDQRAQLAAGHDAFLGEMYPLRDELFRRKMELRELWAKRKPDQARIIEKQQEIRDLQNRMQERATAYQLECREILTPEQREQVTATPASIGGKGAGRNYRTTRW